MDDNAASAPETLDQYVSIGRAAKLLDCHPETLRRWDRAGLITTCRTPGNQRRFRLSDIRQAMSADYAHA